MSAPRSRTRPLRSMLSALLPLGLAAAVGFALPRCKSATSFYEDQGVSPTDGQVAPHEGGPVADAYVNPCLPAPPPSVTGKVYAPNGTDPVAGAAVYVPVALSSLGSTVQCESCAIGGKFRAQTITGADGSFKLDRVPNGTFQLAFQKGHFRRVVEVTVPECGSLEVPREQSTLPGKQREGGPWDTIPRIAVVSGAWDRLEKVLDKLGVKEKTVYNGRDQSTGPESLQALLQNGAVMRSYQLLFINCGTRFEELVTSPGPARNNLKEYVRQGGRLFVTDVSYDFLEQTFPEYVNFEGSPQTPAAQPEEHNAAELGSPDLVLRAEVLDEQLRKWLALPEINALGPDGKVEVRGFDTGWAVASSGNSQLPVTTWVRGEAKWAGGIGPRPLTLSYEFLDGDHKGCGRVVFSSYHTYGEAAELLPQERILEYLMLEMGTCIRIK
ncbi:MAG: hypothetical protein IT371_23915 [Deltaproteobacteria bacterium]|nr:hypothetical protein [Deltaproteobacteria bacterium]